MCTPNKPFPPQGASDQSMLFQQQIQTNQRKQNQQKTNIKFKIAFESKTGKMECILVFLKLRCA